MRTEVVRVVNDVEVDRRVLLEPWGMPLVVPPGGVLELSFSGPDDGVTETEELGVHVTVYAWAGSTVIASLDGEAVYDTSDLPTPPLPGAVSMRDFIKRLFGGPDNTDE